MRTTTGWSSQVANRASIQSACMSLQVDELYCVSWLSAGRDCVGAVVAGFTVDPAMAFGHSEQRLILLIYWIFVAVITARLIQPGIGVFFDFIHSAVAICALHIVLAGHYIPQAFRRRSRMAVIAAIRTIWDLSSMLFMHGLGQTRESSDARCIKCVR